MDGKINEIAPDNYIGLDRFEIISRELGKTITTHEQLCDLLLPKKKKTKPKKVSAPKPVAESE